MINKEIKGILFNGRNQISRICRINLHCIEHLTHENSKYCLILLDFYEI